MNSTPTLPDIRFNPDGSIEGIDGLLDQISTSIGKRILPMIRHEILPILQDDRELQMRIGRGIGREIALPLWALVIGGGLYAGAKLYERYKTQKKIESLADRVMR